MLFILYQAQAPLEVDSYNVEESIGKREEDNV